jgi:YfiR/HmsC-like
MALVGLVLAGSVSSQVSLLGSGPETLEYRVKAAYLINFTRYVEWPAESFETPAAPIVICVLRADPFGPLLDTAVAGRTSQGRPLEARRIRSAEEASGCHLVFVSQKTWRRDLALSKGLARPGMLTVGESEEFARKGGVISFVIRDETVRFVVNARAQGQVGLRISSRMLALAAAVYGGQGSGL